MARTRRRKGPAPVLSLVDRQAAPAEATWTPRDLLVNMIADLDAGKIAPTCLMVFFMQDTPDGRRQPITWSVNLSYAEAMALCMLELNRNMTEWRS